MPNRCVAAGCNTVSGTGCSLHGFPKDESLRRKWVRAVKRQRSSWDGPSSSSLLCSKHFNDDCFVTDGVRFRNELGFPTVKRLKSDAVPSIFAKSIDYLKTRSSSSSTTSRARPLSERRRQRSVSVQHSYKYSPLLPTSFSQLLYVRTYTYSYQTDYLLACMVYRL